jgi:two-component system C4-dicarboxylate transport sensor histidine kinase DctB
MSNLFKQKHIPLLFGLIFIILVIVVHFIWIKDTQRSSLQRLSLIENTLNSAFQKYQYLPELLSHDTRLRLAVEDNDYGSQLNELLKSMQVSAGVDVLYLMNNKGIVIATSNYDKPGSFMNNKYDFRPYFTKSISEGSGLYYGVGITTKIPGYFISSRIEGFNAGFGVIVAKVEANNIESAWKQFAGDVLVVDDNNVVIMSAKKSWKYNSLATLSPEQLKGISKQRQFAGQTPKLIVNNTFTSNLAQFTLWNINAQHFLMDSVQLGNKGNILLKNWRIYYALPFFTIIKKTVYSSLIIALLLYSLYVFIKHRRLIEDTRKIKEKTNKKHHVEMQLIIDQTKVGILTLDQKGNILSNNATFQAMCNQEKNSVIRGGNISEFVVLPKTFEEAINITETFTETSLKEKGCLNSLPIMYIISPININDSLYLMTIVNISKRKKVEEALSFANSRLEKIVEERTLALDLAQKELIRQEKMVVLGRMAAAIVHELSQPLVAFKSALASIAIKQQRNDWKGVNTSLNNLLPLCHNMQDILIQLKSFAYQGGGQTKAQSVELNVLITRLLSTYLEVNSTPIEITLDKHKPLVNVNSTKLEMAVGNLVRNALDAVEKSKDPKVLVSTKVTDQYAIVVVEDNGGYMDKSVAEHIFEPFFTTKSIGKGLGLGLAITNNIIKEYDGNIDVKCLENSTRFTISLPLSLKNKAL